MLSRLLFKKAEIIQLGEKNVKGNGNINNHTLRMMPRIRTANTGRQSWTDTELQMISSTVRPVPMKHTV